MPRGQKTTNVKQKQYCNKLNKNIKNGPHYKEKRLFFLKKENTLNSLSPFLVPYLAKLIRKHWYHLLWHWHGVQTTQALTCETGPYSNPS